MIQIEIIQNKRHDLRESYYLTICSLCRLKKKLLDSIKKKLFVYVCVGVIMRERRTDLCAWHSLGVHSVVLHNLSNLVQCRLQELPNSRLTGA